MDSNLVDSASSHTLVSKIKPCMSKYKILPQKGIDACISSRITTVIQVVRDYQINYN